MARRQIFKLSARYSWLSARIFMAPRQIFIASASHSWLPPDIHSSPPDISWLPARYSWLSASRSWLSADIDGSPRAVHGSRQILMVSASRSWLFARHSWPCAKHSWLWRQASFVNAEHRCQEGWRASPAVNIHVSTETSCRGNVKVRPRSCLDGEPLAFPTCNRCQELSTRRDGRLRSGASSPRNRRTALLQELQWPPFKSGEPYVCDGNEYPDVIGAAPESRNRVIRAVHSANADCRAHYLRDRRTLLAWSSVPRRCISCSGRPHLQRLDPPSRSSPSLLPAAAISDCGDATSRDNVVQTAVGRRVDRLRVGVTMPAS